MAKSEKWRVVKERIIIYRREKDQIKMNECVRHDFHPKEEIEERICSRQYHQHTNERRT